MSNSLNFDIGQASLTDSVSCLWDAAAGPGGDDDKLGLGVGVAADLGHCGDHFTAHAAWERPRLGRSDDDGLLATWSGGHVADGWLGHANHAAGHRFDYVRRHLAGRGHLLQRKG